VPAAAAGDERDVAGGLEVRAQVDCFVGQIEADGGVGVGDGG
jgi:cobalamin biosynthesis protein CbiD